MKTLRQSGLMKVIEGTTTVEEILRVTLSSVGGAMALFAYKGRSGAAAVTGEIEADSRPAAVAALRAKGVVATAIEERKAKAAAAAGTGPGVKIGGSVKAKDLAIYTRQFSTMVDAGLPIAQCLQILSEQSESKVLRDVTGAHRQRRAGRRHAGRVLRQVSQDLRQPLRQHARRRRVGRRARRVSAAAVELHREGRQAQGQGQERDGVPDHHHQRGRSSSSSS